MQTKLTLRLESGLIEEAKKVAAERHTSLSQMVADFFSALTRGGPTTGAPDLPPKTKALYGSLVASRSEIAGEQDYRKFLEEKYS